MDPSTKGRAIIYARVSSSGDRQSTDRQVKDLTDYAAYKGYELLQVFEEHISGAKKNGERPVLREAIERCKAYASDMTTKGEGTSDVILLVSELSRLGRNAFEVLETVKELADSKINLYLQKEGLTLLDDDGKPSIFAPIMIATLSTCAQLERDNITFRLNSGRKRYKENGGKLGRPKGSKTDKETLAIKYKQLIKELRSGMPYRKAAKLCDVSESTAKRIKKTFGI